MKTNLIYSLLFTGLLFVSCKQEITPKPEESKPYESIPVPKAKQEPKELSIHGDTRVDNYFWMRLSDEQKNAEAPDAQTQEVLDYLNAENDYKEKAMKHTEELQKKLYKEIVGRIKKDDSSVPYSDNGYSYYTRFEEGADYALFCRK